MVTGVREQQTCPYLAVSGSRALIKEEWVLASLCFTFTPLYLQRSPARHELVFAWLQHSYSEPLILLPESHLFTYREPKPCTDTQYKNLLYEAVNVCERAHLAVVVACNVWLHWNSISFISKHTV